MRYQAQNGAAKTRLATSFQRRLAAGVNPWDEAQNGSNNTNQSSSNKETEHSPQVHTCGSGQCTGENEGSRGLGSEPTSDDSRKQNSADTCNQPKAPSDYSYSPRVTEPSTKGIIISGNALGCDTEGFEDFNARKSVEQKYAMGEAVAESQPEPTPDDRAIVLYTGPTKPKPTASKPTTDEPNKLSDPKPTAEPKVPREILEALGIPESYCQQTIKDAENGLKQIAHAKDCDGKRLHTYFFQIILACLHDDPLPPEPEFLDDGSVPNRDAELDKINQIRWASNVLRSDADPPDTG